MPSAPDSDEFPDLVNAPDNGSRRLGYLLTGGSALAAGLLIGWLVLGGGDVEGDSAIAAGTLATAIGTLGLALATYYLGARTREVVEASREEAEAAREQGRTAQRALEAETAPFLTNVPAGLIDEPHKRNALTRRVITTRDAASIDAYIASLNESEAWITVPLRNVGNGLALIQTTIFLIGSPEPRTGAPANPALPAGERTRVSLRLPSSSTEYDDVAGPLAAQSNFSVVVAYGDASGTTRGAVRLDVYHDALRMTRPWYVRQVHWGDTWQQARDAPRMSTQPLD